MLEDVVYVFEGLFEHQAFLENRLLGLGKKEILSKGGAAFAD